MSQSVKKDDSTDLPAVAAAEVMSQPMEVTNEDVAVLEGTTEEGVPDKAIANVSNDTTTTGEGDTKEPQDVRLSTNIVSEYVRLDFDKSAEHFLMMVSIAAPFFRTEDRSPIDLVCVIDESSSMSGQRIQFVQEALNFIAKNLESEDRLGIIGYADNSEARMQLTPMDTHGKDQALRLIKKVLPHGCTNLCAGLVQGIQMMRDRQYRNDVSSLMLFTDGEVNRGIQDQPSILKAMKDHAFFREQDPKGITRLPATEDLFKKMAPIFKRKKEAMRRLRNKHRAKLLIKQQEQQDLHTRPELKDTDDLKNDATTKPPDDELKAGELPCTINTFGFGTSHNDQLLQAIADEGLGAYTFIESTDQIAETFGECLGGLVSTVAKNIVVRAEGQNGTKVNKCLSDGFNISQDGDSLCIVQIPDLQSEEKRDLLFELSIPSRDVSMEQDNVLKVTLEYENVVHKTNMSCVALGGNLVRTGSTKDEDDEEKEEPRNEDVEEQHNRLIAARALKEADQLANRNDIKLAKKCLQEAEDLISGTKLYSSANGLFSQHLVQEMKQIRESLVDRVSYTSYGSKAMKSSSKAHYVQRCSNMKNFNVQTKYVTTSKSRMAQNFSK